MLPDSRANRDNRQRCHGTPCQVARRLGHHRRPAAGRRTDWSVCDRFRLLWELVAGTLLLSIDTDLPDDGELVVSASRYFRTTTGDEYTVPYLDTCERVPRWRETRRIPLDADGWCASLEEFATGLALAGKRVGTITNRVEIHAVLHVNQRDSRFGGRGNPNLSGRATSRRGAWVLVEAEETFDCPLE